MVHFLWMSDTRTVRVGPKGRVVIPVAAREALGIEEGDELSVIVEDDAVRIVPTRRLVAGLRGALKDSEINVLDELLQDRRRAAARGECSSSTPRPCSRSCATSQDPMWSSESLRTASSARPTGPRSCRSCIERAIVLSPSRGDCSRPASTSSRSSVTTPSSRQRSGRGIPSCPSPTGAASPLHPDSSCPCSPRTELGAESTSASTSVFFADATVLVGAFRTCA